jgi:hypothetical protein
VTSIAPCIGTKAVVMEKEGCLIRVLTFTAVALDRAGLGSPADGVKDSFYSAFRSYR